MIAGIGDFDLGRFIPACAGNTRRAGWMVIQPSVHPRMRGEHPPPPRKFDGSSGSSPHARGTRALQRPAGAGHRFIPACAGNTTGVSSNVELAAVHPRMRGEHWQATSCGKRCSGSSPHARGTPIANIGLTNTIRFIPACAGNTSRPANGRLQAPVHPRMRGEHGRGGAGTISPAGSSPHARGTPFSLNMTGFCRRFIPACAGNTGMALLTAAAQAVHPRMRGEHPNGRWYLPLTFGSSPHARGTRAVHLSVR